MERWPRINRYDWCGEFSQEEAHAELAEVATTEVPRKRKNMKVLRLPAILAATGWAKATVYAKISQGKFPKPFKLDPGARAVVWWEEEITEWQNAAMAQSRK